MKTAPLVFVLGLGFGLVLGVSGCDTSSPAPAPAKGGDQGESDGTGKKPKPKPKPEIEADAEGESGSLETESEEVSSTAPTEPNSVFELRGVHRSFHAAVGHFFSVDPGEGPAAGYQPEGEVWKVAVKGGEGLAAIHRCRNSLGRSFLSIADDCEGSVKEQTLGFISLTLKPNTLGIVRCYNQGASDIVTTTQQECVGAAYTIQGPQGFALREGFKP